MLKRIVALLVLLMMTGSAMAAGLDVRITAGSSDVLSQGALRALNTWLEDAHLTILAADGKQQITLYQAEEKLLEATADGEASTLTSGAWTAEIENDAVMLEEIPARARETAQKLGELLKDYEKSANATAELGNVVKAKAQLSYALAAEEWAQLWPQVCEIIGPQFADAKLESKGTLRRYFAADGSEIGAYFYAEKVRIAEDDVREVRLEYGYQADKGLYLAFRCPNKNETRNVRISLSLKRTERTDRVSYTVSCDVRRWHDGEQDTVLLDASLKAQENVFSGKATLNYTQKRDGATKKYALTIKPELTNAGGSVAFDLAAGDLKMLTGEMTLDRTEDTEITLPAVNGEVSQVHRAAALQMLSYLQKIADSDRMELIYYLNRSAYLTGDEADVYLMYDPEFTVTEEP